MITWIGLCAGEVWKYLDSNDGRASLENVFTGIDAPRETVLMAVGWLAREGHILIKEKFPSKCTLELRISEKTITGDVV